MAFDPKFHKFDLNESMKLEEKILVYYSTAEHSLWNENSTDEMRYKQKIKCVEDDYGKEKVGTIYEQSVHNKWVCFKVIFLYIAE